MEQAKIDRINFLAKKKKNEGLTEAEISEQAVLRQEFLAEYRANFGGILENTYIKRPDGTKEKLKKM